MSRHKYLPLAHFRKSGTGRLLLTSGTLHYLHFDLTLTRRLDQTLAKFQSINLIQSFFGAYQMKTRRVLRGGLIRIRMSPMWWKTHLVAIWQILDSTAVSIFVDIMVELTNTESAVVTPFLKVHCCTQAGLGSWPEQGEAQEWGGSRQP